MKNWYKTALEEGESLRDFLDDDQYDEIDESSKNGDCYEVSGEYVMDKGIINGGSVTLVHGVVTGQGNIAGVNYDHAWVEEGEDCLDFSNGRDIRLPRTLYYSLGNIDPNKTIRYTPEEMRKKILDNGHWGPWDF